MKRNSFFGGHVPSFMSPCACIIAGLMSLASVGAYASTKSAAEGEVNTPVEALIPMAQDYVNKYYVDTDKSATINTDQELNSLLAGTVSNSILDLTADNIRNILTDNSDEKIFTTFMTTDNQEQVQKNITVLNSSINQISETYDKMIQNYDATIEDMNSVIEFLSDLKTFFQSTSFTTIGEVNNDIDNEIMIQDKLSLTAVRLESVKSKIENIGKAYLSLTDNTYGPAEEQIKQLKNEILSIQKQKEAAMVGQTPRDQIIDELFEANTQAQKTIRLFRILKVQYENLKENDINFIQALLKKQTEFNEDGASSAEEQAASKELLNKLVENASPMTRNYIIKLAEEQYKPENDPTGINDVNTSAKVDGNVYKTATEIYRLDGQSVTVYDYSGKLLRTEPLDLKIQTGFAQ
ncbi:MAG: hypothetical protein K6E73_00540 [Bacteroidales bacterium]|nr:hypothetical protein [Bacteroidales bacterium]